MNPNAFSRVHPPARLKRLILGHVLGVEADTLIAKNPDDLLTDAQHTQYKQLLEEYAQGKPLSRLLGYREFWSLRFDLCDATLDPRPDSETLIEAVLETHPDPSAPLKILDLGTGSGCLIISLLTEYPNAQGTAIDVSTQALHQAQLNAERHHVAHRCQFIQSNWLQEIEKNSSFDIILSNPPYIAPEAYEDLEDTVRHYDPKRALIAAENGLKDYKKILKELDVKSITFKQGFFEIGSTQKEDLSSLLEAHRFQPLRTYCDLENRPRIIQFQRIER